MAEFRFGHVLSDETEQLLKELSERLALSTEEVLEEAVRMYASSVPASAEVQAADMSMNRISAAIALDASPAVVVQLAQAGMIRVARTEQGDRYSREDVEREAKALERERQRGRNE